METKHGIKYRQLHIEDYLREIPAEQERATGVYAHEWITGNPDTNTDFWTDNLLDTILRSDNLNAAYKKERRGHKFVRYVDDCIDCIIFCKSRKSAERTMEHIIPYIKEKLFLKVNLQKTTVSHVSKVKYLGYGFYRYRRKCRLRVHPKSVEKMKNCLRKLTTRGNKWSNPEREKKLREMGKKLGEKVHPHKFRRTMATRAIEKGMPIEQVQKILGHEQIDTTLRYAMVNQNNVKLSHRKYIS